jgi:hypothetical protein
MSNAVLRPFRFDLKDGVTNGSGAWQRLFDFSIAPQPKRLLWVFFDHTGLTTGKESWVRFYKANELVLEIPAAIKPTSSTRFGCAGYKSALDARFIDDSSFFGTIQANTNGAGVLWWNNSDTALLDYALHALPVNIEADQITLEHNCASGTARALLAILSMP